MKNDQLNFEENSLTDFMISVHKLIQFLSILAWRILIKN